MRKLSIIILAAAAACAANPAAAQDNRRQTRTNCTEQNPCTERRGAFLWFYLGQDEGQRPTRRVVRRLALDD
jgi:hypothetical protein